MVTLDELLKITVDKNASDLHIIPEYYPAIRINNDLYPLQLTEILTGDATKAILMPILSDKQKEDLMTNKEIDFSYEIAGKHRFRINYYITKNNLAGAFRLIPSVIKTIEQLNLPPLFHTFTKVNQGLILFTGPTGEGKSTSLASIINEINVKSAKHIITIEDPIEFVYPPGQSIISQREMHNDSLSLPIALRSILREDPDVVLLGEMRDYETIQSALTIAETGHLVFSTLHTMSSPDTIDRIIDVFPAHQQNQIRNQLASVLYAIVSQRLLPNIDHTGRIVATELLLNTAPVSANIREGKAFMIDNIMETSESENMIIFEKSLAKLHAKGLISRETAYAAAIRPSEIKKFIP